MKTTTTSIWNCLSTKNSYMEIWKAWLPSHISYSTSSMQFWIRENSFGGNFGVILSFWASALVSVFLLSPESETPAHTTPCSVDPQSLTCFQSCRAFHADSRPAAHRGAGAQVEQILAHRFQITEDPFGGTGVADVDCLHWPCLSVID